MDIDEITEAFVELVKQMPECIVGKYEMALLEVRLYVAMWENMYGI